MSLRPNCPECPAWWTYSTEDGGTYSRLIGIDEHDRIVRWRCPDCDHEWERNDEALIWGPTTHPTPPVPTQESRQ